MEINTIIFDLDGTLLDTLEDLADSVNYTLNQFGFPARTTAEIRSFVGNGVKVLLSLAVPAGTSPETTAACLAVFRSHYSENMEQKTTLYDGIAPLLEALKTRGYRTAVVSNKFDGAVKALCTHFFSDRIQVAIGESEAIGKKPAPQGVWAALESLDATKEEALYVGDSEVDVQTAQNAGVPVVGVTWGFRDRAVLEKAGATVIINHPSDLLAYLDSLKK